MREEEFQIGDLVRLKSDGPIMTISDIDVKENEVKCVWYNYNANSYYFDEFDLRTIKRAEE